MAVGARIDVRYEPKGEFERVLLQRVAARRAEVEATGSSRRRLWKEATLTAAWFYASWAVLLFVQLTTWQAVLAVVSLGFALAGTAMIVGHDAIHGAYSSRRWVNALVLEFGMPIGMSRSWWAAKHTVLHHGYTNISGVDDDIEVHALARFAEDKPWHPWHRWQHIYMWPLYVVFYFSTILAADSTYLLHGRIGEYQLGPSGRRWIPIRLIEKYYVLATLLTVAALFHPVATVLLVWLAAGSIFGLIMALVIQIEHCSDVAVFPAPAGTVDRLDRTWVRNQLLSTTNAATSNRLLTLFTGGANHHIEHHLFPRMPHTLLPALAPVVRATCEEFGVPYFEFPTFRSAVAAHFRHLQRLSARPTTVAPREMKRGLDLEAA